MTSLKRLLKSLKSYYKLVILVILATIGVTATNLSGPWIVRELVAIISGDGVGGVERITQLSLILIALYVGRSLFQFVTNYTAHWVAWDLVAKLRVRLYNHMQRLSLSYYQDKQTGQLMSRIVNDTEKLEPLLAHAVPDVIVNALMLVGVATILFSLNPLLTLYTLVPMPFIAVAAYLFGKLARPAFREAQESMAQLNALVQDNISGIKEIQIFTRERLEKSRVATRAYTYTRDLMYALKLNAIHHPTIEWLTSFGTVIVMFFGGRLALQNQMPVEDIVAFLLYLGLFYQPIVVLSRLNEGFQQALASSDRIFEVLDTEQVIKEQPTARQLSNVAGKVEFENVDFSYIDHAEVLKDINFTIEPGKTLALVGPTGVGKSTIVSLIPRFYDPKRGKVSIDGIDIKDVSFDSLRNNISMVLQDIFLFNGTVEENILYGNPKATHEDVIEAAKLANAHEFICELVEGYETHIGERGVKLSGGQKQRLSIARAILKNSPILILDEATSAVDSETEHLIQQALDVLMTDRTSIVIAHRLSTIKDADAIAVLENGAIVQYGTHDDLLQQEGLYRRLYLQQFSPQEVA